MKRPIVGAIIQARTGSTRLPGKIFRKLVGEPLLKHVLTRLQACRTLNKIVIATTNLPEDEAVMKFAEEQQVCSFAGESDDVQKRFIDAAKEHGVELIVRICSDSPFIDPVMIDRMVNAVIDERADYAEPSPRIQSAQEGFEVVTLRALKKSRFMSDAGPHREHVTLHIRKSKGAFQKLHLKPDKELWGHYRLSVDNYADLEFARAVYDALWKPGQIVDLREMVNFLKQNPEVYSKNAHVRQKDTAAVSRRVAFYIPSRVNFNDEILNAKIKKTARMLNEHYHCGIAVFSRKDVSLQEYTELGYRTEKSLLENDDLFHALAHHKIDYVVVCGPVENALTESMTGEGYGLLHLDEKPRLLIKAVVTGKAKMQQTQHYTWPN